MASRTRRCHSLTRRPLSPSIFVNQTKPRCPLPDNQGDVIVTVDGVTFKLHKFPLCARSGHFSKLLKQQMGYDPFKVDLSNLPGSANYFELAIKFCYGVKFEIDSTIVAALRCVAEYLEMTEEFGTDNLIACTELYLREVVFESLKESAQVLCSCHSILSSAEDVKLTQRCIDAIASIVCNFYAEQRSSVQLRKLMGKIDWWTDELISLPIDFFQQVIMAMKLQGLPAACVGGALIHYARRFIKPWNTFIREGCEPTREHGDCLEHVQRIVVETIVNLLPAEKSVVPTSFLFGLLRTARLLGTTVACRMALEERIGAQFESATLEELLIPSLSSEKGDTLFDVDLVHRLVANFVQQDMNADLSKNCHSTNGLNSSSLQVAVMGVAKLVDSYLAEIAADANLNTTKFISLVELLPKHARVVDDGIYRAIDIYLKVHPATSDADRRNICRLMNCQKLSQKASTHAAQNERLPVHVMVKVLYMEQLRLNSDPVAKHYGEPFHPFNPSQSRAVSGSLSRVASPLGDYSSLKQENESLRLQLMRMRSRLCDLEQSHDPCMAPTPRLVNKPSSMKKLLSFVSRTLSRINPFFSTNSPAVGTRQQGHLMSTPHRMRRHSVS